MTNAFTDPPLRQLTRLRSEMGIAAHQLTSRLFPENVLLGMEFGTVARVCLPDWAQGTDLARPAAPGRTISVRKLALLLGGSPETTRRHINLLIERGILASSAQGLSLAVTPANETFVLGYYLAVHDLFLRLADDVSKTCDLDLPIAAPPAFDARDVIERALDTLLLPIDTFRPAGVSRIGFLLWAALTVVAVRGVTYDPVLSRRYRNTIPADDVRSSTSLRRLAAAAFVPYATAWRQMRILEGMGLVTQTGSDSWTVLEGNLRTESVHSLGTQPSMLVLGKLRELALLGLDPTLAARHYRNGPPPLADLGDAATAGG